MVWVTEGNKLAVAIIGTALGLTGACMFFFRPLSFSRRSRASLKGRNQHFPSELAAYLRQALVLMRKPEDVIKEFPTIFGRAVAEYRGVMYIRFLTPVTGRNADHLPEDTVFIDLITSGDPVVTGEIRPSSGRFSGLLELLHRPAGSFVDTASEPSGFLDRHADLATMARRFGARRVLVGQLRAMATCYGVIAVFLEDDKVPVDLQAFQNYLDQVGLFACLARYGVAAQVRRLAHSVLLPWLDGGCTWNSHRVCSCRPRRT